MWDKLESCSALSDNSLLCLLFMVTGWEWVMVLAFVGGIVGLIAKGTGKKTDETKDEE